MRNCRYCGFDNTPLPGESPPENCEGCGVSLDEAVSGTPDISMREFV
jgi:hypothetical protein